MVKVKLCGITNDKDAGWAAGLGVDFMGFNFFKDSPRAISDANAKIIIAKLPPFISTVGVFVDEDIKEIKRIVKKTGIKIVQLHGSESVAYVAELKNSIPGIEIIKAFRMKGEETLSEIPAYDVNYYLLDAYVEGVPGGTGAVFNWELAARAKDFGKPVILAGGITPRNVAAAIEKVKPFCVDAASGVERLPRRKDYDLVHELLERVREAR